MNDAFIPQSWDNKSKLIASRGGMWGALSLLYYYLLYNN